MLTSTLPLALSYQPKVIPTLSPAQVFKHFAMRNIVLQDFRRIGKEYQTKEYDIPDYNFIVRPDYETVTKLLVETLELLNKAEHSGSTLELAFDIETRVGHISDIGFAWSSTSAICIPIMSASKQEGYWTSEEEVQIIHLLLCIFSSPALRILGQNFSYDAQYIYRHWCTVLTCHQDTMLSNHTCFPSMQKSLDFLSSLYCKHHIYWKDEGKEWNTSIGEEEHWIYNCKDCVKTFEIAQVLKQVIRDMRVEEVHTFQQSLFAPVLETMNRGVRIDQKRRGEFAVTLIQEIQERQNWINSAVSFDLNIRSNQQMQEFFYHDLKQKPVRDRKSGSISCSDEALRKVAEREPLLRSLIRKISELRSLHVFYSTFVTAPLDIDGRMRCSFNIGGTETFRFSSRKNAFGSGMNMQNIPKGGEDDELSLPNVRSLFIPDKGMEFFDIDLDSADLRTVVWESDEQEMKAMINEGKKVYVEVMKEYYHDPSLTKKSPQYGTFKSFCHGTNYLGTAAGLASRLALTVHEVDKLQKWYFGKFPKIKKWQDRVKNSVITKRMVENVFGYRCYFFDRIEGTIFNQAIAWIPQSTVACIINRGYRKIYDELKEVEVLLQVHDSLAGQYPTAKRDTLLPAIIDKCSITLPYPDPMIIPVGVKTSIISWGECD